jgi:hypothetical protein
VRSNLTTMLTALAVACLLPNGVQAQPKGKIVFSTSPINAASPQNLTATFKAGDPIYAAVTLPTPLKVLCAGRISNNATKESLELKHFVDGAYKDSGFLTVKGEYFSQARAFLMDVAPEPARMTAYKDASLEYRKFGQMTDGAMMWSAELGGLSAGSHKFRIEVGACGGDTQASGEFTIQGASYAHYAQLGPALQGQQTLTVTMSPAKMNDKALEGALLGAMKASPNQAWKDQILRIVIVDPEWFIERHPISGVILFRYLRAEVAVKSGDGSCSFYKLCTFKQNWQGGRYGGTYSDGHGDRVKLPCESVNK